MGGITHSMILKRIKIVLIALDYKKSGDISICQGLAF